MNFIYSIIMLLVAIQANSSAENNNECTVESNMLESIVQKTWRDTNVGEVLEVLQDKAKLCDVIKSITIQNIISFFAVLYIIYIFRRFINDTKKNMEKLDKIGEKISRSGF